MFVHSSTQENDLQWLLSGHRVILKLTPNVLRFVVYDPLFDMGEGDALAVYETFSKPVMTEADDIDVEDIMFEGATGWRLRAFNHVNGNGLKALEQLYQVVSQMPLIRFGESHAAKCAVQNRMKQYFTS